MLKIYFAGKYDNKFLIKCLINSLYIKCCSELLSFEVMSQWHDLSFKEYCAKECAALDFGNLENSNLLIATQPFGSGTCSEMGYALGKNIPIIYIIEKEFYNNDIKQEWGWNHPLPSGKLHLFDANKFVAMPGNIVHNFDELFSAIKYYRRY